MNVERNVSECLADGRARINPAEAMLLLMQVLQRPQAWLYAHGDAPVPAAAAARFRELVARRAAGEPLAYILGHTGFWTLDLEVTPDTLIPRPETELLVEAALARLPTTLRPTGRTGSNATKDQPGVTTRSTSSITINARVPLSQPR